MSPGSTRWDYEGGSAWSFSVPRPSRVPVWRTCESQRLCLARTLVTKPDVVLLDEVTASVDPTARLGIEALARELADRQVRILWVTHDLEQMRRLAAHVVVLIAGRIAFAGGLGDLDRAGGPDIRKFLAALPPDEEIAHE